MRDRDRVVDSLSCRGVPTTVGFWGDSEPKGNCPALGAAPGKAVDELPLPPLPPPLPPLEYPSLTGDDAADVAAFLQTWGHILAVRL